jgi:hypothetical protein
MNWMVRRFIPLVLAVAVVIVASPIARELCAASCAEESTASAPSPHAHHGSGHSMAGDEMPSQHMHGAQSQTTPQAQTSMSGGSDEQSLAGCSLSLSIGSASGCLHDGEWQAASAPSAKLVLDAPAVLAKALEAPGPPGTVTSFARVGSVPNPPIPLAHGTPLRV